MNKADLIVETGSIDFEKQPVGIDDPKPAKKKFVVPQIAVPVDVLEATTFFQLTDSGATN